MTLVFIPRSRTFSYHISKIFGSTVRLLGSICRLPYEVSNQLCIISLFCSSVRSSLEFASVVRNYLTATDELQTEKVKNKFIRIVYDRYFGRRCFYDYTCILDTLSLQKISSRRVARDILMLHKITHGQIDSILLPSVNIYAPLFFKRHSCFFYGGSQDKV